MQHSPFIIAKGHIPKGNIIGGRCNIFSVLVDIFRTFQRLQLIHGRINKPQHMSRIVNVLHTAKYHKREQHEHQKICKAHLSFKCLPCTDKHNPHRCQFQGKQVQTVKWRIAFFHLDMNVFQILVRASETLNRSPFLSERFDNRQSPDVFNRSTRHTLHSTVRYNGILFTMPADPIQSQCREDNTDNGNHYRHRAKENEAEDNSDKLRISIDDNVHHLHTLQFKRR